MRTQNQQLRSHWKWICPLYCWLLYAGFNRIDRTCTKITSYCYWHITFERGVRVKPYYPDKRFHTQWTIESRKVVPIQLSGSHTKSCRSSCVCTPSAARSPTSMGVLIARSVRPLQCAIHSAR